MKKILAALIATLLLCGCDGFNAYREGAMNRHLFTGEEFLKIISENEDALGLTVDDFADFDVDGFVERYRITETLMGYYIDDNDYFLRLYKMYSKQMIRNKIDEFQPQELTSVYSTVDEFEIFKANYFERIGNVQRLDGANDKPGSFYHARAVIDNLTEGYMWEDEEGEVTTFVMGRTMHFDQLNEDYWYWDFREDPIRVYIYFGDGTGYGPSFFISKNGKFFIAFTTYLQSEYPVQAFCEIDD